MAFVAVVFLLYSYCFHVFLAFCTFPTLVVCFLLYALLDTGCLRDDPSASYEQNSFILYSLVDYMHLSHVGSPCLPELFLPCGPG